jgi:hypothetical protein
MDKNRRLLNVDTGRLIPGPSPIRILPLCLLLSPPCVIGGVQTNVKEDTNGWNTNDHRATNEDSSDEDNYVFYPLPRIEIQFLCGHEIRPDFSPADALQQYYVDVFLSKVEDYNPNDEAFQLNAAVSISDVSDVKESEWFFPLCNQSSMDVLVTMDVSGYVGLRGEEEQARDQFRTYPTDAYLKNTTWYAIDHMDRRVGTHSLREYFHENICQGDDLVFFYSNAIYYNDPLWTWPSPAPQPNESSDPPTATTTDPPYPSSNNPSFFDHNLYLLCGGAEDMLESGEFSNSSLVVLGLFVGMVLVGVIFTEWKAPVRGLRDPLIENTDDYVIRPTRALE